MHAQSHPKRGPALRIAIDTGGTFTDCVWMEGGVLKTLKVFSTPDDPHAPSLRRLPRSVRKPALRCCTEQPSAPTRCCNERRARGARHHAGFEDVIEIGRQARPRLYDFFFDRIPPLVERDMRFGVNERIDAEGGVLERPSDAELARLRETVLRARPEAIAISLLFSFANSENETRVGAALAGLGVPLSVSHKILPEFANTNAPARWL